MAVTILYRKSKVTDSAEVGKLCEKNDQYHLDAGLIQTMPFEMRKYEVAFIAKDNDTVVGVITAIRQMDAQLNIVDLYVDEKYRGKGIGSRLLEFMKIYARHHRFNCLQIGCFIQNEPAYRLYNKLGFQVKQVKMVMDLSSLDS